MHAPSRSTLAFTMVLAMTASAVGRAQTAEPPKAPVGAPAAAQPAGAPVGPALAAMPPTT